MRGRVGDFHKASGCGTPANEKSQFVLCTPREQASRGSKQQKFRCFQWRQDQGHSNPLAKLRSLLQLVPESSPGHHSKSGKYQCAHGMLDLKITLQSGGNSEGKHVTDSSNTHGLGLAPVLAFPFQSLCCCLGGGGSWPCW